MADSSKREQQISMEQGLTAEDRSLLQRLGIWWHRLRRSPVGFTGAIMFISVLFVAILAPVIATHDPTEINMADKFLPPVFDGGSMEHILGTDQLGRDIFSQIIYGTRVSLLIGLTSVTGSFIVGVVLGVIAGYYGGIVDTVIMRIVDTLQSIPSIVVLMAVIAALGPSTYTIILVFTLTWWRSYTRIVRGEVLAAKRREFVEAARAVGVGPVTIMFRHLLPNVISASVALATLSVASTIIAESSLSFLGLGPQDIVTWGRMISNGREYLATVWWMAVLPGIAIFYTVIGIVFLGDWFRDALDPRIRAQY